MVDIEVERLVERLHETREIKDAILEHLGRQDGAPRGTVVWNDGSLHRLGEDEDLI